MATMFNHPIFDVGLGLIFFYVVLSLVASAVQEWIASLFALRSNNLHKGVHNLIGDEYAAKVYEHPLVKNLAKEKKLPSYIAPETLSRVLLEVIAKENSGKSYASHKADELREMVNKIPQNHPIKAILEVLIDDREGGVVDLTNKLAAWFDEGMSRIAGWYKRQAKSIIFVIAAVVTIATNASSIHLAEELWRNDALRSQVVAQAQIAVSAGDVSSFENNNTLQGLETFPIGWRDFPKNCISWLTTLLGWVITIAAISLGAPFWFDLLGKVANLRGAGGKK